MIEFALANQWHSYDKKLLDSHVKEIAKILYKNAPIEKLETFEGIETTVRDQVLEQVNPKIAFLGARSLASYADAGSHRFFYLRKNWNPQRTYPKNKKLCW